MLLRSLRQLQRDGRGVRQAVRATCPRTVGPWEGDDMKAETGHARAGRRRQPRVAAVHQHATRGRPVDLWLIVGHARDICRHTPDICYPEPGLLADRRPVKQHDRCRRRTTSIRPTFFTAKFRNESTLGNAVERVFWAWNGNEEGKDEWDAPEAEEHLELAAGQDDGPQGVLRQQHGAVQDVLHRARWPTTTSRWPTTSPIEFAELMLPEINRALFPERYGRAGGGRRRARPPTRRKRPPPPAGEPSSGRRTPRRAPPATIAPACRRAASRPRSPAIRRGERLAARAAQKKRGATIGAPLFR